MHKKFVNLVLALMIMLIGLPSFASSYGFPQAAEDSASANADNLIRSGGVRKDVVDTTTTSTDGDISQINTDKRGCLLTVPEPTGKTTYMATVAPVARAASAGDMMRFPGSASKTIKVQKIYATYSTASSTLALNQFYLIKRSTAGSGGTPGAGGSGVALDSNNAGASSVGIVDYTANPTVGTPVGTLAIIGCPTPISSGVVADAGMGMRGLCLFDADKFGQPVTLRGTAENICVNNNGATLAGTTPICGFIVVWTEE